ncbi:MAG: hypothetical protein Q9197_004453, partial [Variospora fuerteventurae]
MKGIFTSAGQNCIGIERIIALPNTYALLVPLLTTRIQNLRLGSSLSNNNNNNNHHNNSNETIDI